MTSLMISRMTSLMTSLLASLMASLMTSLIRYAEVAREYCGIDEATAALFARTGYYHLALAPHQLTMLVLNTNIWHVRNSRVPPSACGHLCEHLSNREARLIWTRAPHLAGKKLCGWSGRGGRPGLRCRPPWAVRMDGLAGAPLMAS